MTLMVRYTVPTDTDEAYAQAEYEPAVRHILDYLADSKAEARAILDGEDAREYVLPAATLGLAPGTTPAETEKTLPENVVIEDGDEVEGAA